MAGDRTPPADGALRWWILALLSAVMFGNYYVYDAIGPLADQLQTTLGYSDTQIGTLNAIYSLPNIVLVLIGGLLVDRFGAGRVILWTTALCLVGAVVTAATGHFAVMAAGRLLFGMGAETMLVAQTTAIALWFFRSRVALAMALNVSLGRAGSYAADVSPVWAGSFYDAGWQPPLYLAAGMAGLSLLAAIVYRRQERAHRVPGVAAGAMPAVVQERVEWRHVLRFDRSYWYILALCVLFYSVIFPFRSTFAIKYFQHAHALPLETAATLNSYVFLAAVFATPLFGWLTDRLGRRALLMVFGSLLLPVSFLVLLYTDLGLWVTTVLLGISFSLVPAVLWPSVAKLVRPERLGTAYGLMTMLQNIGLTTFNLAAGRLNDLASAGPGHPEGYTPMLVFFTVTSLAAFLFAVLLRHRETGPRSHGLERPDKGTPEPMAGVV